MLKPGVICELDCGNGCYATLSCNSLLPLSGMVIFRVEMSGNWPSPHGPIQEGTYGSVYIGMHDRFWLQIGGGQPNRSSQRDIPNWFEWDVDTTEFGDGDVTCYFCCEVYQPDWDNPASATTMPPPVFRGHMPKAWKPFLFSFKNGNAYRRPSPNLGSLVLRPGEGLLIHVTETPDLLCDGSRESLSARTDWKTSNSEVISAGTAVKEGLCTVEVVGHKGRTSLIPVTVREDTQCIPHLLRGGGISKEYVRDKSFFPRYLMGPGGPLDPPWFVGGYKRARLNAIGASFAPYLPDQYPNATEFRKATQSIYKEVVEEFVKEGLQIAMSGDNIFASTLPMWANHLDYVEILGEEMAKSGAICLLRGQDETHMARGNDPTKMSQEWQDQYLTVLEALRRGGWTTICHGGGGPLWAKEPWGNVLSNYPNATSPDFPPDNGPQPDNCKEVIWNHRRGNVKLGYIGTDNIPAETLFTISGVNYSKYVPGHYYSTGDVLRRGGVPPISVIAQTFFAIYHEYCALALYTPEAEYQIEYRLNSSISKPGKVSDCQTGLIPSEVICPTYRALRIAFTWLDRYERALLSRPVSCPSYHPLLLWCARDGGVGNRIVVCYNPEPRLVPLPKVALFPGLYSPRVIDTRDQHLGQEGYMLKPGCFASYADH